MRALHILKYLFHTFPLSHTVHSIVSWINSKYPPQIRWFTEMDYMETFLLNNRRIIIVYFRSFCIRFPPIRWFTKMDYMETFLFSNGRITIVYFWSFCKTSASFFRKFVDLKKWNIWKPGILITALLSFFLSIASASFFRKLVNLQKSFIWKLNCGIIIVYLRSLCIHPPFIVFFRKFVDLKKCNIYMVYGNLAHE